MNDVRIFSKEQAEKLAKVDRMLVKLKDAGRSRGRTTCPCGISKEPRMRLWYGGPRTARAFCPDCGFSMMS